MYVTKRDGRKESVNFDKIVRRIQAINLCVDQNNIEADVIAYKSIEGFYDGISTCEIDTLVGEVAATMVVKHPDYGKLAAGIAISNLHKNTKERRFSDLAKQLYIYKDPQTGQDAGLVSKEFYEIVVANAAELDDAVCYSRDYLFDYFGFKTLERSYLLKMNGKTAECPQDMFMRVAIGIHKQDIKSAIETYELMSRKLFIHATPTLFNAGTRFPQLASCFLLPIKEDSIDGIYDTLKTCAKISQSAGGIGLSIHDIRATGSYIKGTGGSSNGLMPMLRVYNETARYIDQGGGKRKGSFAMYLEPWHADIYSFLDIRKNTGKEENRARDLFTALWVPDLFMKRVEENKHWSLFCPNEAPGLSDCWGGEFEKLYESYENAGKAREKIRAQDLWFKILEAQCETGTPYVLFKDACNRKSNQQNLGTIKCSNLCAEIVEYSAPDEIAVCNLASVSLAPFVQNDKFDYASLFQVIKIMTINLNKVIDHSHYPVPEARESNERHRPIGIGVQGLADVFFKLRLPFESPQAAELNRLIFETIYFAALTASCDLAAQYGPYPTYSGSPISKGMLQCDLWGVEPRSSWRWGFLREKIARHGVRNSLLIALMPTASTAQILGNTECIEPQTSNIFLRRVLSGEFIVINQYLIKDLMHLGLWNDEMKQRILAANGSVQHIEEIPVPLKDIYKTVWEIKQKTLIDLAADRAPFVCQSQSLNLYLEDTSFKKITSMLFYAWKKGLKTGMYYLRSRPAVDPIKFTINETLRNRFSCEATEACVACSA